MWPFALIGIAGLTVSTLLDYEGVMKAVTFGPSGAFLVFACAAQDLYRKPLKLGILNEGGKISYGVYLIHPLLLPVLAVLIFSQLGHGWPAIIVLTTSVLTLTVFLAWLSMKFLEVPVNLWLRKRLGLNAARAQVQREHVAVGVTNSPVTKPSIRKAA
jgi:exopolysaccharide production protein ExoZ